MVKKGKPFILDSGELCVQIPNDVITRNHKRWESFIIGQFHGNLPSHGALHAIFNGIWRNRSRDITVSKLGPRSVLIRIPCPATRKRVLGQGIWHIEGQSMFVADWEPGLSPTMPELTSVPVWLEFRGVPPHFFSEEGFEHVAGMLGHPLYCHPSTVNMTNMEVGKVFTIIDPSKPLPEAVNVQFDNGAIHRVEVSCPWLPPICAHCQQIGHSIRRCPTAPVTCAPCNSSAHPLELCPRAKKSAPPSLGKEKADVPTNPLFRSSPKKKSSKRFSHKASAGVKIIDQVPPPTTVVAYDKREGKRIVGTKSQSNRKPPVSSTINGNLVVDIGLGSLRNDKPSSHFGSKVQSGSKILKDASSSKVRHIYYSSSSDSERAHVSGTEEDEEGEISPELEDSYGSEDTGQIGKDLDEENLHFTKVLSRKQRRLERNNLGWSPNPKNH